MQPAELELALQVMDKLLHEEDETGKNWKLSLERAQYEANRVERQYQQIEPENRLVARSLEARWNEKLNELAQLQQQYEQYVSRPSWHPTEQDKMKILGLSQELPRIWSESSTTSKDRKRILRLLIEDVTIFAEPRNSDTRLGLRWRNQYCEELQVIKPLPRHMAAKHSAQTAELVRTLAETMTDQQIANHLNESGTRTPDGRLFTVDSIQWIRYTYRIPGYASRRRGLTVKEVAERLKVDPGVVYYWINRGILTAEKAAPGWPWDIQLDEQKEFELRERIKKSGHLNRASHC